MRLLLRRYRLILCAISGFSAFAFRAGGLAAFASVPLVHPVSSTEMTNVLASTRNASLAAQHMVGASGAAVVQGFEDIAVIDACVLETPLDVSDQAVARDTIATQYRQNHEGFMKSLEFEHRIAQLLLHGSPNEQMQARTIAWMGWINTAQNSPLAARWVATVKRHDLPIVTANGIVVTNRQLDALFVSNDWVAQAAKLPVSTPVSRAGFAWTLPNRFASMTQVEQMQIALADLRWDALLEVINFGLKDKAIEIVQQNVHKSNDIAMGARHLENAALRFEQGLAQLNRQMAARTLAIMGGVGQGAVAESMNMAQDRFEGKFDATPHH
jgi:hypothetical protein